MQIVLYLDSMRKISNNLKKFYWSAVVKDIALHVLKLNWNGIVFDLKVLDNKAIHELLKIITYRADISLANMTNKEAIDFIEDIRLILANNGFTLTVDNDEWERIIREYGEC